MSECPNCDAVYRERDQLVAALSKQYAAHLARHVGEWEDDWRNIVCIHLPTGQATWHIHDSELHLFAHLLSRPDPGNHWDGHDTDEKYRRVAALIPRPPLQVGIRCNAPSGHSVRTTGRSSATAASPGSEVAKLATSSSSPGASDAAS